MLRPAFPLSPRRTKPGLTPLCTTLETTKARARDSLAPFSKEKPTALGSAQEGFSFASGTLTSNCQTVPLVALDRASSSSSALASWRSAVSKPSVNQL